MTALPPVCHIPPIEPKTQPEPVSLPSIPPAEATIQSLVHTVNQMRIVINYITGRQGPRGAQGKSGDKAKPARWTEESRVTETVRVFQHNDPTSENWIDVERVNQLKMKDGVTNESWTWDRNRK